MKPQLLVLFLTVTVLIIGAPVSFATTTTGHNITSILDKYPDFTTFNYYLTATNLASEINRRQNITVLAVDNAVMTLISIFHDEHLSDPTLKNVLSLHVLLDYFDVTKLAQITNETTHVASMFQATGSAAGIVGYVNINILKDGRIGFSAEDNGCFYSFYVKSVDEKPDVISVLQISQPLTSAEAEVPTISQSQVDVISIMSTHGCKAFADLLRYSNALLTFTDKFNGGLTVFCPIDSAVNGFIPIYKNLTEAKRVSLLLYHGVPVYQSLEQLSNGVVNTLATEGANKYEITVQNDGDQEDVKLETKVNTANIVTTLLDVDPFAAYRISNVLMPIELFKGVVEEDTAPAESPKAAAKKKKMEGEAPADSPADSEVVFPIAADAPAPGPDSEADYQEADDDDNGVSGLNNGYRFIMVFFSLFIGGFGSVIA